RVIIEIANEVQKLIDEDQEFKRAEREFNQALYAEDNGLESSFKNITFDSVKDNEDEIKEEKMAEAVLEMMNGQP
ncbi:hypothetical protein ACJMK2_044402, partial [Sinanodonta woodiana]